MDVATDVDARKQWWRQMRHCVESIVDNATSGAAYTESTLRFAILKHGDDSDRGRSIVIDRQSNTDAVRRATTEMMFHHGVPLVAMIVQPWKDCVVLCSAQECAAMLSCRCAARLFVALSATVNARDRIRLVQHYDILVEHVVQYQLARMRVT